MEHMTARIARRWVTAEDRTTVVVPRGVTLFHGTAESFGGQLRPGADGFVWLADQPGIAQLYISPAGAYTERQIRDLLTSDPDPIEQQVLDLIGFDPDPQAFQRRWLAERGVRLPAGALTGEALVDAVTSAYTREELIKALRKEPESKWEHWAIEQIEPYLDDDKDALGDWWDLDFRGDDWLKVVDTETLRSEVRQLSYQAVKNVGVSQWGPGTSPYGRANSPDLLRALQEKLDASGFEAPGNEEVGFRDDSIRIYLSGDKVLPPGFRQQGRLFVCKVTEPLRLWNSAWDNRGSGDQYNLTSRTMKALYEGGFDGLLIEDVAQAKRKGNLLHHSVGLFRRALGKIKCKALPARYDTSEGGGATPEFPNPPAAFLHRLVRPVQRVAHRWLVADRGRATIDEAVSRLERKGLTIRMQEGRWSHRALSRYEGERKGTRQVRNRKWALDVYDAAGVLRGHIYFTEAERAFLPNAGPGKRQQIRSQHKTYMVGDEERWYVTRWSLMPAPQDGTERPWTQQDKKEFAELLGWKARVARTVVAARPIPIDKGYLRGLAKRVVAETLRYLEKEHKGRPAKQYKRLGAYRRGHGPHFEVSEPLRIDRAVRLGEGIVPVDAEAHLWVTAADEDAVPGMKKLVAGGAWMDLSDFYPGSRHDVVVKLYRQNTAAALENQAGVLEKEVYSTLIHEVTHLVDLLEMEHRGGSKGFDEKGERLVDPSAYFNDPNEVRAFMQQIADQVVEAIDSEGMTITEALYDNRLWQRLKDGGLSDENRKLVLKGVYTAVEDAGLSAGS